MAIKHNPDILLCLANLSNDEVFTSPKLANQILDMLPDDIWKDKNATFLDPVCKTGVFLREIAVRLDKGLAEIIKDKQERINHIFTKQIFGIAVTELTALISRRTVYCAKVANSKFSVCSAFPKGKSGEDGNIKYSKIEHSWKDNKCTFCGASKEVYGKNKENENYAYQFIHTDKPEGIFNMKFDVIIGNPPYQLNDGGFGTSAAPIYHKFVEQAIKLNPKYMTFIIPARWYSGGKGLDEFRDKMLNDNRIRKIVDFPEAIDCFPGVQIKGGVCYFLWERDNKGQCEVITSKKGNIASNMTRSLLEKGCDTFIRYNEAITILNKVRKLKENSIASQISSSKPFGLRTFIKGEEKKFKNSIVLYQNGGIGFVKKSVITANTELINKYKVLVPALGSGSDTFPHPILGIPFVVEPNTACTETYIVVGAYDNKKQCENLAKYITTRFFRFMVLLKKNTQHATKKVYSFVPIQDFNEEWTDSKLYKKYKLNKEEIEFIESMIRPMDLTKGTDNHEVSND